jgi:hypothetical protein
MSGDTSISPAQEAASPRPRQRILYVALCVAALANALVPGAYFSERLLFGYTDLRYRALVTIVVVAEYAIAFLLLRLHANVGFASGYAVATAVIVTLGSAMLAYSTVDSAGWIWNTLYTKIPLLGGFAFAVLSNTVFFVASIRYAHAIHPRLHRSGFFFGIVASLALLFLYARILS